MPGASSILSTNCGRRPLYLKRINSSVNTFMPSKCFSQQIDELRTLEACVRAQRVFETSAELRSPIHEVPHDLLPGGGLRRPQVADESGFVRHSYI